MTFLWGTWAAALFNGGDSCHSLRFGTLLFLNAPTEKDKNREFVQCGTRILKDKNQILPICTQQRTKWTIRHLLVHNRELFHKSGSRYYNTKHARIVKTVWSAVPPADTDGSWSNRQGEFFCAIHSKEELGFFYCDGVLRHDIPISESPLAQCRHTSQSPAERILFP
jgi:hypothetical protein